MHTAAEGLLWQVGGQSLDLSTDLQSETQISVYLEGDCSDTRTRL